MLPSAGVLAREGGCPAPIAAPFSIGRPKTTEKPVESAHTTSTIAGAESIANQHAAHDGHDRARSVEDVSGGGTQPPDPPIEEGAPPPGVLRAAVAGGGRAPPLP